MEDGALRLLRVDDDSLTNPNQGAVWNFPAGDTGRLTARVRLEEGGSGLQIALCDRWFNASDPTVDQFANYVLKVDGNGVTPDGKRLLKPGQEHEIAITWRDASRNGDATLAVDGRMTNIRIPGKHAPVNGVSYVHFYNPADATDLKGASILSTRAQVK